MSETIPQDILASAQFIAARLYVDCSDHDVEIIALAILDHERETIERCAKIVDAIAEAAEAAIPDVHGELANLNKDLLRYHAEGARHLATAIRETAR